MCKHIHLVIIKFPTVNTKMSADTELDHNHNTLIIDESSANDPTNIEHDFISNQLRPKMKNYKLEESKQLFKNNITKLCEAVESSSNIEAITLANNNIVTLLSSVNALTSSSSEVLKNAEKAPPNKKIKPQVRSFQKVKKRKKNKKTEVEKAKPTHCHLKKNK